MGAVAGIANRYARSPVTSLEADDERPVIGRLEPSDRIGLSGVECVEP